MEKIDAHLTQKLWGLKFLIEQFYYDNRKSQKNKAVLIDKMQTFWMLYGPFLKEEAVLDKTMTANFRKFLRDKRVPLYDLKEKPPIEQMDAWFSSPVTRNRFIDIYSNDHFDFSNPNDVVLAFNLADGLLEKPEIREYAVLESLYFRKKGVGSFSEAKADKLQEEFSSEFKKSDNNFLCSLIEGFSAEEIQEAFRVLSNDVVSYFQYQKRNKYPMINIKLFQLWVDDVFSLLDYIINKIMAMITSNKNSLIESYFPNISNKERPITDFQYHSLYIYLDDNFTKKFTNATNDLAYLIIMIFSHVSLNFFGICANKSCRQQRLFLKFPKANKDYCSNLCAAYAATYRKRSEEKEKRTA
jgi:hypothetical protein